jgi:hypothetical protein
MDGAIVQVASDGRVVYRASALGGCIRALAAARQEYFLYDAPEKMKGLYGRGVVAEDTAVEKLMQQGWGVWMRQREVMLPVTGLVSVVGHLDAIGKLQHTTLERVIEVKSCTDEEFGKPYDEWRLWYKYSWQISVYMWALRLPCLLVQIHRDSGEITCWTINKPPYTEQEIRARVLMAEHLATQEISDIECERLEYPCPVFYTHQKFIPEELDDSELAGLARGYESVRAREKRVKEQRKVIGDAIVKKVGEAEIDKPRKVQAEGIRISVSKYKVKEVIIPAREQTRLTVTLPKETSEQGEG